MKNTVKTFQLFVRSDERSQQIANTIRELNQKTTTPLVESDNADLVIAIGGDGTFIDAVTSTNFSKEIIYTGIHTGTLGFLQDLCENDVLSLIQYIKFEKEFKTRKVYIASVKIHLNTGFTINFFALNDIVVAGTDYSKIHFDEYINGELHFKYDYKERLLDKNLRYNSTLEDDLFRMFVSSTNGNKILEKNEFKKYCKKNFRTLNSWFLPHPRESGGRSSADEPQSAAAVRWHPGLHPAA